MNKLKKQAIQLDIKDTDENFVLIQNIMKSRQIYEITNSSKQTCSKTNGYVGTILKRRNAKFKLKSVFPFLNTGILVKSKKCKFWFLPDRVIVCKGSKLYQYTYNDFDIYTANEPFIEHKRVPKDAEVIGKHWQHTNKDGSRDQRYSKNKSLPVVNYGVVYIKLDGTIITSYQYSNINV